MKNTLATETQKTSMLFLILIHTQMFKYKKKNVWVICKREWVGRDKLTDKLITDLILYNGVSIRRHPDSTEEVKEVVRATYYHKSSTDKNTQHDFCSEKDESWCKWCVTEIQGTFVLFKHNLLLQNGI